MLLDRATRLFLTGLFTLAGCSADGDDEPAAATDGNGIESLTSADASTGGGGEADASSEASSASESSGGGPDDACGEADFMLDVVPARVLLVLDKSGSMVSNTWDHDDDPSTEEIARWASLHETVEMVATSFEGGLELGVLLYPSMAATATYDANACLVADAPEVPVAPEHGDAVLAAIPGREDDASIHGGTPSASALATALDHLRAMGDEVPRAVLFVTDGEANCRADADPEVPSELFEDYDDSVHTVVEEGWQIDGIPTYVVGIAIRQQDTPVVMDGVPDGINPDEKLDELAEQGGRPREGEGARYYATANQVELEDALREIAGQEVSCVVPLDPEPEHPDFVELQVGGATIERVDDCATEDGWVFVNPEGPFDAVELCGDACNKLASQGALQAFYGCPPPA